MMTIERAFMKGPRVHRFRVCAGSMGWHVQEERDATVLQDVHFSDWHRVERAVRLFETSVMALERDGWSERTQAEK